MMVRTKWKWFAGAGIVLVAVTVAVLAHAQKRDKAGLDREHTLATVNGTPISVSRFNESYVNFLIATGRNDTPENRFIHLNSLLDTYLLAEEAVRRGIDSQPPFQSYRDRKLRHTVGGQYYSEAFLGSLPPLTDAEIRLAFKRSKESVVVRHLLFRDVEEADRAYDRLQVGEDFVQLANEVFQTAEYDSMAGFLGVAGYWELDDAFAEAAFAQPVGIPTRPVRTPYGYHIILVEDYLSTPLLTEDEYNYRKKGVSQKAHQRKGRIEGTRFILDFMSSLNVQVNRPAVYQLSEAIGRLSVQPDELTQQLPQRLSSAEVAELEVDFTPETVLLTYDLDGQTRPFTALDYYRWLEELPYTEARSRTAASVGRALRNEVLALKGFDAELEKHETVTEYMTFVSRAFLARELQKYLRNHEKAEPTDEEVEEAFTRLGYRKLKKATADFWLIETTTFQEGEEIRSKIEAGSAPGSFPGYTHYQNEDLGPLGSVGAHVRRTLLNRPTVIGTDSGEWYVMQVDDRDVQWTTLEEHRDEIVERLTTFMPEAKLARDLRATAEVTVDTTLFHEMMKPR